jgi:hypothetical protein
MLSQRLLWKRPRRSFLGLRLRLCLRVRCAAMLRGERPQAPAVMNADRSPGGYGDRFAEWDGPRCARPRVATEALSSWRRNHREL